MKRSATLRIGLETDRIEALKYLNLANLPKEFRKIVDSFEACLKNKKLQKPAQDLMLNPLQKPRWEIEIETIFGRCTWRSISQIRKRNRQHCR
jgi:hypothetical protein